MFYVFFFSSYALAGIRQYTANADESIWELEKTTRLSCRLNHTIPAYGEAQFNSYASKSKPMSFTIDMLIKPNDYDVAAVKSIPPMWKPGIPSKELANLKLLKQFDGELDSKTTWLMLTELEKGFTPTFYYQDWNNQNDKILVGLLSVNFKKVYLEFLKCRDRMLAYSFEDIAFTVMNYESNTGELTKASKKRLDKIGEYLKNDPSIESVLISAYTDSYGGRYLNETWSKKRAKAIKAYMTDLGVEALRVKVEGFGEKRHISSNRTILGRDKNRRVVIQIAKPN
ncbi:flagellar protein MotY [Pseudoalteromonas denitrificans]|uniref:flagellar protein MotY n=1 Tax=Pseudoalteromonas denitrificans TaxID=43656 RepID=UPI000B878DA4|nr:OmpA family protein [Pseudoalteromonas denitrificans]